MRRSKAQQAAHEAALRIERLVKRSGVNSRCRFGRSVCDLPHWPGVCTRLVLWSRIEREVTRAIRRARLQK